MIDSVHGTDVGETTIDGMILVAIAVASLTKSRAVGRARDDSWIHCEGNRGDEG